MVVIVVLCGLEISLRMATGWVGRTVVHSAIAAALDEALCLFAKKLFNHGCHPVRHGAVLIWRADFADVVSVAAWQDR